MKTHKSTNSQGSRNNYNERSESRIDIESEKYYEAEDKKAKGDKSNYLENYQECLKEFKDSKISLDNKIFVTQLTPTINPLFKTMVSVMEMNEDGAEPNKDTVESWDAAFAYYLYHVCNKEVRPEVYKEACKFVILYREAFNQYGLDKLIIEENASDELRYYVTNLNKKYTDKSLCEIVSPEYLPDIANDMYIFYQFQYQKLGLLKDLVKELTLNFTSWLSKYDLTAAKVIRVDQPYNNALP